MSRFLAGATGIAPSASKFGGTDFQSTQRLERLLKRAFWLDFCFLKGFSCLLGPFYIELCKTARKTFIFDRFGTFTSTGWSEDIAMVKYSLDHLLGVDHDLRGLRKADLQRQVHSLFTSN